MNSLFSEYRRRDEAERVAEDADQAEWQAVRFGNATADSGIRDEVMGGEITKLEQEDAASSIADEIERRREILRGHYPFETDGNSLIWRASKTKVYEFCLGLSFLDSLSTKLGAPYEIAFERLTRDVLICHLGIDAVGFRTGHPSDPLEPREKGIKSRIEEIQGAAGPREWAWSALPDFPNDPNSGDLGMDVVAWNPFLDGRGNHLFFVGQCGCGHATWKNKFNEPNEEHIKSWVNPIANLHFVKVLAVPFHIANVSHFDNVTREAQSVLLDRARIVEICERPRNVRRIKSSARVPYGRLLKDLIGDAKAVRRGKRRRARKGGAARSFR